MKALQFRIISEHEASALEREAHNPAVYSDGFTEDDFSEEWWSVREALKSRLELFGNEWLLATDEGDFMLSESRGNSRWIYVTFTSTRLWKPDFVVAVAELLSQLPQDYRVACLTELDDNDLFEEPQVYLVISSAGVFGRAERGRLEPDGTLTWRDSNDELQRFGFPINTSAREP